MGIMVDGKHYHFKDSEYDTSKDKESILITWWRFLNGGFKREDFTKKLYEHLHLHCGFITHYDIDGFYSTYFDDPADTLEFMGEIKNLDSSPGYDDINAAMSDVIAVLMEDLKGRFEKQVKENDIDRARALLGKYGLSVGEKQ